ncbi:hypothetical protein I6N95_04990 [Vagococcus sp. BWB3-3]|uniref:Uncharacterized protein n=1 Tax=Vagococcus allomyrinae TaxID=2794353 RepID=A0A940STJ8_9ENTE|nr:hypothetical protein [Vagococcus allomyrinae]MBP1040365.1 hypothetical protein [Vagococcus allomyrinae]
MELKLKVNGKEKKYKSKVISFKVMRRALEMVTQYGDEFFGSGSNTAQQMDEALELIHAYFGIPIEVFEEHFEGEGMQDFYEFFFGVLNDIQTNGGKRKPEVDSEGK